MLEAMVNGETDPEKLAGFARRTMKKKKEELELALRGNMSSHQRMMLKTMLIHVDFLNEQIVELDMEVAKRLAPFQQDLDRLDSIPGSSGEPLSKSLPRLIPTLLRDSQAPRICAHGSVLFQPITNARANASLPKPAKATNISVPLSSKPLTLYGDLRIISELNTDESQLAKVSTEQPFHISIMTIAYHLLTRQEDYKDLGADYFEKRHQDAIVKQTVRKLENLGFSVTLARPEAS